MQTTIVTNGELRHFGVPGMKHYEHKFGKWQKHAQYANGQADPDAGPSKPTYSERRERRQIKRRLSATLRNYKNAGENAREADKAYDEAFKELQSAMRKQTFLGIGSASKQAAVAEAQEKVRQADANLEMPRSELNRAERIYMDNVKAMREWTDSMVAKYGDRNVPAIKTREIEIGEGYIQEIIKTGPTIINFPIIGSLIEGKIVSDADWEDRQKTLDKRANMH